MLTRLRTLPNLPFWCLLGWVIGLISQINIAITIDTFASKLGALQLSLTYISFQQNMMTWTADDVTRYYAHLGFDLLHPMIYGVALALNLAWGFRAAGVASRYDVWLAAPLIAGLLDEVENYSHYVAVSMYLPSSEIAPDLPWWTFGVGCTAAKVKWVLALGTIAILPVLAWHARRRSHS